jgi:hypothetical protein
MLPFRRNQGYGALDRLARSGPLDPHGVFGLRSLGSILSLEQHCDRRNRPARRISNDALDLSFLLWSGGLRQRRRHRQADQRNQKQRNDAQSNEDRHPPAPAANRARRRTQFALAAFGTQDFQPRKLLSTGQDSAPCAGSQT